MITLVTGGAGFIGSHLVEKLVSDGHEVRVIDDLSTGDVANLKAVRTSCRFFQGSILDSELLLQVLQNVDAVFHLAAKVSVPESYEMPAEYECINTQGTEKLLAAARSAGVRRVIFSSTCAVYGDAQTMPIKETTPTMPLSPYARTKLSGEELGLLAAQSGGPGFTALRYFNVYGPRQSPKSPYSGVISRFADAIKNGMQPTVYGDGKQTRDFIHVEDIVQANVLAATREDEIFARYNVGTGEETSILDLVHFMKRKSSNVIQPRHLPSRKAEISRSVADYSLIKQKLGFQPQATVRDRVSELVQIT